MEKEDAGIYGGGPMSDTGAPIICKKVDCRPRCGEKERERVGEQVELISMLQRTENINQHTIHIGNLFVHIHNTQWHCLQHTTSHKLHHACIMGQCFWQASVSQSSFSPHGHWSGSSLVLSSTMTEKHTAQCSKDLTGSEFYPRDLYFIYDQMVHLSLSHFN